MTVYAGNLGERDAGQAFMGSLTDPNVRIPSRYDVTYRPLEAQKRAAEDLRTGKIKRELFDSVIAAASRTMNKKKIKENFDRLSGLNSRMESRLRTREVHELVPPVAVVSKRFTQDGGLSLAVEASGCEFAIKVDSSGRTFVQAEDVSAVPLAAQKAAAQKARLVWHAENSKPRWGFKNFRMAEETEDYNAFNTKLAKLVKRLKKDTGATSIQQNYKGTGRQKHRRQLYIYWPNGKRMDLWLDSGYVEFGGVMRTSIPKLQCLDTPEETYREIVRRIKAWLGPMEALEFSEGDDYRRLIAEKYALREDKIAVMRQQLGRKALYMLGAKDFVRSGDNQLTFRIGKNGKSINWIRMTLMPSDTYKLEFGRGYRKPKVVATETDVHVDQLHKMIEAHTGMYTSL